MADRGQRLTLTFGGVAVEVALHKSSGKPTEAKHDTRRMIGDLQADDARAKALRKWGERPDVTISGNTAIVGDPSGFVAGAQSMETEARNTAGLFLDDAEPEPAADPFADLPPERVEQGVYLPIDGESQEVQDFTQDGEWLDLTDRLAEIDERTKIDGLEVVATIPSPSVPRMRVRDASYVGLAPDAQGTPKVLALLYASLKKTGRVAVVRWTKRTNQALGIIVPMSDPLALVLLEVEWAANMRKPSARVQQPLMVGVSDGELQAATKLAEALGVGAAYLDSVRDERMGKRAELLEAARAGTLDKYEPPPEPARTTDRDLAAALLP